MYSKHNMILVNIQLWKNFPKNRAVYYEDHYNKNKKKTYSDFIDQSSIRQNHLTKMQACPRKINKANEWKKKTR